MPDLDLDLESQQTLTRSENQFSADESGKSDQFYAFFSVNPLAAFAVEESRYWIEQGVHHGLKLHFANSEVDFSNPDHLRRIQRVLKTVDGPGMPIMVHLRNRDPDYGGKEVQVFIEQLLPHAPQSTFIIAHAGGWGIYDRNTESALDAFIKAAESGGLDLSREFFDPSAVLVPNRFAPDLMTDESIDRFYSRFRKLGVSNWVFGRDFSPPKPPSPPQYIELLQAYGLKEAELLSIVGNRLFFIGD